MLHCSMSYFTKYFVLIALLLCKQGLCGPDGKAPKVTLPHGGVLIGSYAETENGVHFRTFRGIPYAEPPIESLRFKPPVPTKNWTGEKHAVKEGNNCLSQNPFTRIFVTTGEEDCLYLNIYVPEVKPDQSLYSVMVYLHGGGFVTGNGDSDMYGPHKLMGHNVILVSGNYRLGALGFLTTGTKECPGNNGMKDQTMMLKWVQENIEAFGGNPQDVTIFGESAGAASVAHHIFSPLSKGYFHKAILQSGTNFDSWAVGDAFETVERTKKIGLLLDCPVNNSDWQGFMDCLRTKPASQIASIFKELLVYDIEPSVLFSPVVEPDAEDAFITRHPKDVDNPPSGQVPIIIGLNSDEGLFKSLGLIHFLKDDFIQKFEIALPQILYYSHYPKDVQQKITKQIDECYFKGKHDWSLENHQNLTNLMTDGYFTWGMDKFLRDRFAATEKDIVGSTYIYLLDQQAPNSYASYFMNTSKYYGVCHGDDLLYLFSGNTQDMKGNANHEQLKRAMPEMWSNFAKTGNPTPDTSDIPKWIPSNKFPLNYARLGSKTNEDRAVLSNAVGLFEDRVQCGRTLENNL